MKCPCCGDEMTAGFLVSSRDITFTEEKPNEHPIFRVRKRSDLELNKGSGGAIPNCAAYHCINCKKILIDYAN